MTPLPGRPGPVRYGSRDGSAPPGHAHGCPVCATALPSTRARYCSEACKQRAYRRRQSEAVVADLAGPVVAVRPWSDQATLMIYECPTCDARYLGERRCSDCHRFCRKLGPGGACPHCDEPILLAELLDKEVLL